MESVTPHRAEMSSVTVIIGGDPVDRAVLALLPATDTVVAADSGADLAHALGLTPDVVIGDMDSISDVGLAAAAKAATTVVEHPPAKDHTDLELALAHALDLGARHITVVGGNGGRIDHVLGNAAAIAATIPHLDTLAWHPTATSTIHGVGAHQVTINGTIDDLVSLVVIGADATGVTTTGLQWPLTDAVLPATSALGISNTLTSPTASINVLAGTVLAIHQHNQRHNQRSDERTP